MVSKAILLFGFVAILIPSSSFHAFYVSIHHITIDEESTQVSWNCRMFKDDFERAVIHSSLSPMEWFFEPSDTSSVTILVDYFTNHTDLSIDNIPIVLKFEDVELEGEGPIQTIACSFSSKLITDNASNVRIRCSLLTDLLDDQINMIHLQKADMKRSKNLDSDSQHLHIEF